MPALSTSVGKVLEICNRTDASPNELNKVISLDPVLTGQVLKLINSSYYSLVNKVTSLTRAITMLGMNTVKNMALSTAIINTVRSTKKSKILPTTKFWEHSIGTGVSAKVLGQAAGLGHAEREELFLAGLLHDLGKIPYGDEYAEVIRVVKEEQISLIEAERSVIGIDHEEVGEMIAEKWKLNTGIRTCIVSHHDIEKIETLGEYQKSTALVGLGDFFANVYDFGYAGNLYPEEEKMAQLLDLAGITLEQFYALRNTVEDEIHKAEIFLKV